MRCATSQKTPAPQSCAFRFTPTRSWARRSRTCDRAASERLHMCTHRAGKAAEIITAFEHGNQPPPRVFVGNIEHDRCQLREILICERKVAQRIADAGVASS